MVCSLLDFHRAVVVLQLKSHRWQESKWISNKERENVSRRTDAQFMSFMSMWFYMKAGSSLVCYCISNPCHRNTKEYINRTKCDSFTVEKKKPKCKLLWTTINLVNILGIRSPFIQVILLCCISLTSLYNFF